MFLGGEGDSAYSSCRGRPRSLVILNRGRNRGGCVGFTGLACSLGWAALLVSDDSALVCAVAAQFVQTEEERACSGAALALGASLGCSCGGGLGIARVVPCHGSDSCCQIGSSDGRLGVLSRTMNESVRSSGNRFSSGTGLVLKIG